MLARRGVADRIKGFYERIAARIGGAPWRVARGSAESTVPQADTDELVRLLDETLELARGMFDQRKRAPVELGQLIGAIVAQSGADRVTLEQGPGPIHTLANIPAIERLFEILIANALTEGTRAVIRLDHGTTDLVAHVDDDGPGVPRAERDALFDLPSRLTRATAFGTGPRRAGLAIAREIAQRHGGKLAVSSSPEGGARFSVRLPLLLEDAAELPQDARLPIAS